MTEQAGAASAATEPVMRAQTDGGDDVRADASSPSSPAVERSKETARASIDRAFAGLEEPASRAEADEQKGARSAGKDGQPARSTNDAAEPPARFSADAKSAWADVPNTVRAETHRALKELNEGLSRYQAMVEPLKPYQQLAEQHGTTVHDTLGRYVALDFALLSKTADERMNAIASVLEYAGITPQDYAARIMSQKPPEPQASSGDETIRDLRQEITELRTQMGGMSKSLEQRVDDEISKQVSAFAADNPRLKEPELQRMIVRLLTGNLAQDLKSAFDMAVRLSPEPASDPQVPASNAAVRKPASAPARNGNLSITGAPGSGSNPARRKTPQTARESVDSAFASLGLG